VTDRRTDRRTDRILIAIPRLHYMQRGKNVIVHKKSSCYVLVCFFCVIVSRFLSRINISLIYTVSGKKDATLFFAITCQILTNLQNSFTITLSNKFPIKKSLNIPPSFTHVATLPCKTVVLKIVNYFVGLY